MILFLIKKFTRISCIFARITRSMRFIFQASRNDINDRKVNARKFYLSDLAYDSLSTVYIKFIKLLKLQDHRSYCTSRKSRNCLRFDRFKFTVAIPCSELQQLRLSAYSRV